MTISTKTVAQWRDEIWRWMAKAECERRRNRSHAAEIYERTIGAVFGEIAGMRESEEVTIAIQGGI